MLRSRPKTGDTLRQSCGFPDFDFDVEDQQFSKESSSRFRRMGSSRMKTCFVVILFLMIVTLDRVDKWRVGVENSFAVVAPHSGRVERRKTQHENNSAQGESNSLTASNSTWRYPLVDRVILHELDHLQDSFMDDNSFDSNHSLDDRVQWQPRVTRLPEDLSRSRSADENTRLTKESICETSAHPQPCRFLFPVRVAEQESKARIHLFQLAQLASRLNRTLVLPKVGKSKIGACFKWDFQTYYDLESLKSTLNDAPVVDQEDFQAWLEALERPTLQLFSVGPPLVATKGERSVNGIHIYNAPPYDGWKDDIPGCLYKSRWLDDIHPTFMTVSQSALSGGLNVLSDSMAEVLSDESLSNRSGYPAPTTQTLLLDWNLRYPLFSPSFNQQLQYSRTLIALARQLAPPTVYLVVHWRMETIDPSVLADCGHALVDLLVRLLHDESISNDITTVWFASDYPYPIAPRTKTQPRLALEAKSGTFKEFEVRHEEAVQVLRKAFEEGGELERWKLTDISEAIESHAVDEELLNDPGILGILDKLIGIQAKLFVGGSKRCARRRYVSLS